MAVRNDVLTTLGPDVDEMAEDWYRSLRARRLAPKTIRNYSEAVARLSAFLRAKGMPTAIGSITSDYVQMHMESLNEAGLAASTVSIDYRALRPFFKWCVGEGEITRSPMANMQQPVIPETPVPVISTEDMQRLLDTCKGRSLEDKRDRALLLFLYDTGVRRDEVVGLTLDDLDKNKQTAYVIGKGSRPRVVPYTDRVADALAKYERERKRYMPAKGVRKLWVGRKGGLTYHGIGQVLERRAAMAGLKGIHAHRFRHTFAHNWLADGQTEGDLMSLAGWKERAMLDRYAKSTAAERARAAYQSRTPKDDLR